MKSSFVIQIAQLKKQLETVRGHRQQYRDRRASVPIPVVSLVLQSNHVSFPDYCCQT